MTQEEKAKAYDKAIEKIKYVMEHGVSPTLNKEDLQDIFTELKESEDEKIRRELIDYHRSMAAQADDYVHEAWIVWLEKQGEHTIACSEEQMKVLNEVLNFAANHESPYWNYYIFETLNNFIRQLKN